ncbi:class II fructose-bisphosphate aldolase, partial [Bacillus sp. WP8]|uniref:class II fructose-bisphosphate aldolase n=1 Tax=Bacillus sp. WP8 TaxID=756828 RepID=UPI0016425621
MIPLLSITQIFKHPNQKPYPLRHFNLNNLQFTQPILQAAQQDRSPLILPLSQPAPPYMARFKTLLPILKALIQEYN